MSDSRPFDVEAIRRDFPILEREIRGKPLVFLDTAASAQKPQVVLDAIQDFYTSGYANIHRGIYQLSAEATRRFEAAREVVQRFLGAADAREIVFVRNTTEAINLVARTWGEENLGAGDEIVITAMEHHANIVPWQMLGERRGTVLRVAPIDERGDVLLDEFEALLGEHTKLVAISHVSNALGTINPLAEMIAIAKERGITVLVDGAQAVPHMKVDVAALGCDFYAFSGHKLFGPSGIGVLYGRLPILDAMPPFLGGGEMIESVTFEKSTYAPVPHKFEAGTPDIAGAIGLSPAIHYLEEIGRDRIATHEHALLVHATEALGAIEGLRLIGTARQKAAVVSFVVDGVHAHDVGTVLDQAGIAVRVGHHCAQPLMEIFGVPATVRASFSLYNTHDEVDVLAAAVRDTLEIFR
ncbi:MAG: cysteine desulfurase [Deltaproteobacteria bacterium]|nr:cysteine desulfurase [Deltaproteobacteria bacterium]